jgi:ribosomal protein S18 acetylase RimI-like enzyme
MTMNTVSTRTKIVPAQKEHSAFIAWVMLAAARSHLERGVWDLFVGADEAACLRYLEGLATTEARHLFHWSNFIVAEVDGEPAAGMCGYFDAECGVPAVIEGQRQADAALGRSAEETAAGWGRAGSIMYCSQEHEAGAWIVENVATRPEFRRRGLVDALLREIIERGRAKGAKIADIGVYIDNYRAQQAYEKAGFNVIGEKRNAEFEAAYGCPGVRFLTRTI